MPIATPKTTDENGDVIEPDEGDIVVLDENGNEIHFKPLQID